MENQFVGSKSVYYIERYSNVTKETNIMSYESYSGTYRPMENIENSEGSLNFDFISGVVKMNNQMEAMKVEFGMVPSTQYVYNIIRLDEKTYHVNESNEEILVEIQEEETDIPA